MRPCAYVHCARNIESTNPRAAYCSRSCKESAKQQRDHAAAEKHPQIAQCGTHSGYVMHRRRNENACDKCKLATVEYQLGRRRARGIQPQAIGSNECRVCGKLTSKANFCSDACRSVGLNNPRQCPECGDSFIGRNLLVKYCSLECRRRFGHRLSLARHGNARFVWDEVTKARWHRRRALRVKATIGEPFTNIEIFDRDGWECGVCHEPVGKQVAYPDPMSKSLDHVVPLSRGGSHSRSNVQLAHLVCNMRKGARPEPLPRRMEIH